MEPEQDRLKLTKITEEQKSQQTKTILKELTLEEIAKAKNIRQIGITLLFDFDTSDRNFGYPDMNRERETIVPSLAPIEANAFVLSKPSRFGNYRFAVAVQFYRLD